jgi:hypothetical protein
MRSNLPTREGDGGSTFSSKDSMRAIAATLIIWCTLAIAGAQTSQQGSAQGRQKGMMQGNMSGMMDHCKMHCRENMNAMSTLSKQVEVARESNDLSKMRAALDAVAKHHQEMRQHMQTCMNNMGSGDPKSGSAGSDHQHPSATPPATK